MLQSLRFFTELNHIPSVEVIGEVQLAIGINEKEGESIRFVSGLSFSLFLFPSLSLSLSLSLSFFALFSSSALGIELQVY